LPQAATLSIQNRHFTAAATAFPESGRGHGLELSIDQLLDASAGNAGGLLQVATLSTQNRHLAAPATSFQESGRSHCLELSIEQILDATASNARGLPQAATSCHIVNSKQPLYSCSYSFSKIW
jgi:hypothetical protein